MPSALRRIAPAAGIVLGVAALLKVVYDPWYLNYDARYALVWAQDLAGGHAPEYRADFAPTPRPFQTAVALLLLPLGDGADTGMTWFTLLAYALLGVLAYVVGARVFNRPAALRDYNEKLSIFRFPQFIAPTLVSARAELIDGFLAEHGDIIVKPLFGNGGAGVFHVKPDDMNLNAMLEMFTERSREPLVVQKYVPAVRQGDKRIIMVDGEALGAVNRVPAAGEARSNLHVGGRPERTTLTGREREICARIGPELRSRGLVFVGLDVIGGYLTEINVTSPTGLQEIARLDGVHLERAIWDAIEARATPRG